MTTLHDRLADLADDARTTPPGPTDLWQRGRRQHRRRVAATAASVLAVALLATLGAAGLAGRTLHQVEPVAPPTPRTVLPDRFFEPNGRLPVAHDGTGPLVAVIPADHFSWTGHGEQGLVGVSALDQSYSFLDLPGWVGTNSDVTSWSLSPNGRWVAYWYGDREPTASSHPADGIAVVDTTTGEVRRFGLDSKLGVGDPPVSWTGDTLWFAEWDFTELRADGGATRLVAAYAWPLGEDEAHQVADPHQLVEGSVGPAGVDGFLAAGNGGCCRPIFGADDLVSPGSARIKIHVSPFAGASVSPDGHTVAIAQVGQDGEEPTDGATTVLVGTVDGDRVRLAPLLADVGPAPRVLGWLDDRTVLVEDYGDDGRSVVAADIGTGKTRTLTRFAVPYDDTTQLARDLLRSPVVHAVRPPHGHDPRVVAGGVGLAVLLVLGAGLAVRRRRARG